MAAPEAGASPARDAFPHTRRPLPWVLAAFVAMLFLVPIDSTELKVSLPVGAQIDRFAVVGLILAWLLFGGDQRAFLRTRRSKLYVGAACLFLVLAVASLLLDSGRILNIGDFTLAEKRFGLLGSFLVLSWFTLTALRFEDLRGFSTYLIGLGAAMSVGMVIERHTGFNVFYELSAAILKPIATIAPSPTDIHPTYGTDGRVVVVGPTLHGLAATTMLMVTMPFALVRMFDATSRRSWWLNAIALSLMLVAAAATDRKTALLVPIAVVLYLACYRPRKVLRLAPIGLVALVGLVHFASPGALGTIFTPSAGLESSSTAHRVGDFTDVAPDVLAHPVLGRGFGTINVEAPTQFRINDDEYIDEIWEVGVVGLLAYMFMILAPVLSARRAIRTRDPAVSSLALAASAGCIAYFAVNALFDAMSFPQAPYMFFMVAALTVIAAAGPAGNVVSSRERLRQLARRRARALADASA
ncbi:MAG: O-antigen ligase family protein [Solirubrobacteraceae bacterium]